MKVWIYSFCLFLLMPLEAEHERSNLSITIYNNGFALVKDRRKMTIRRGIQSFEIDHLSGDIFPESILVKTFGTKYPVDLLEYQFKYIKPSLKSGGNSLLNRYIGKRVQVETKHGKTAEGVLLNANEKEAYVRTGGDVVTAPSSTLVFKDGAKNRIAFPMLYLTLKAREHANVSLDISYLTRRLNWAVNYTAEFHPEDNTLDLAGMAEVTNSTITNYKNADIQLAVANQEVTAAAGDAKSLEASLQAISLASRKPFDLNHNVTLNSKEKVHLTVLDLNNRGYEETFRLLYPGVPVMESTDIILKKEVESVVTVDKEGGRHAYPTLPNGKVLVYKRDKKGHITYLGRSLLKSVSEKAVRFSKGTTDKVTATLQQVDFKRLSPSIFEAGYKLEFESKNKKDSIVYVGALLPKGAKLIRTNLPTEARVDEKKINWKLTIPPFKKERLWYRVRVFEGTK